MSESDTCGWKWDDFHFKFDTACDNAFCFDGEFAPGPSYRYCPGCGRLIQITPPNHEQTKTP